MDTPIPETFVRDDERERNLAEDEATLLRMVEDAAASGKISKQSAQTFDLYIQGMSKTIKHWRAPQ